MSATAEYTAALSGAILVPDSGGARFRMLGPDARDYLHRMASNDFLSLTPGQGARGCILEVDGRLIADFRAWIIDEETILVETAAETLVPLMTALEKYIIMERLELEDATAELDRTTVLGSGARGCASEALGQDVNGISEWRCVAADPLVLVGTALGQVSGLDIYSPQAQTVELRDALSKAGTLDGSRQTLDIFRVEAGEPAWGAELTNRTIPLEANLVGRAVSFTKGCYPGQEIIARIHSRGQPAKQLRGIRLEGTVPPAPDTDVVWDGNAVGVVTSAVQSPRLGVIAMAYLDKNHLDPDQPVTVGGVPGVTSLLPF